jgi:hypothetical protein
MDLPHAKASSQAEAFSPEISDLVVGISQLPPETRGRLEPALNRVVEGVQRRKRILSLVQEALSQLRLDMKYLMFDLEATRRERDALQAELEDRRDS